MRFFKKNKVSDNILKNIKKDKNEPTRTIVEHKKVCTIPVYLWKEELQNINKETIMKNLLDYDYYKYALEDNYFTVKDCKRWVSDGDTMMWFRIYEIKVEITYEIETVKYSYEDDTRVYKEITSIKYLGVCRRVPFEDLGFEKIFTCKGENLLINSLNDVDKLHKIKFADYCRDKYFSMTKESGLESDFIKEIYEHRIKSTFNGFSYITIRNTNDAIYYINKIIEENKSSSKEMLAYKIAKELNLA